MQIGEAVVRSRWIGSGRGDPPRSEPVKRHFPERTLTPEQARAVIGALAFRRQVGGELEHELATAIIQRLKPEDYEALSEALARPGGLDEHAADERLEKALAALNSPSSYRLLQKLKGREAATVPRKAGKTLRLEEDLNEIRGYFEKGLLPGDAFIDAPDVPPGLNPRVVSLWMGKKRPKIAEDHLAYVLERCRALDRGV